MSRLPRNWRVPFWLLLFSVAIAALGDAGRAGFAFTRAGVPAGEVWRIITGHLAHLGWSHLVLNAAGVLGVWGCYASDLTPGRSLAVFLTCAVGISAGLYLFDPNVDYYVGLSGSLHGLLAAGAIFSLARRPGFWFDWLVLGVVAAKVTYEVFTGPVDLTQTLSGGPVVTASHLYGAISGALLSLVLILKQTQSV